MFRHYCMPLYMYSLVVKHGVTEKTKNLHLREKSVTENFFFNKRPGAMQFCKRGAFIKKKITEITVSYINSFNEMLLIEFMS